MDRNRRALLTQFEGLTLADAEKKFRADMVELALEATGGHQEKAAGMLSIHRNTLTRIKSEGGMQMSPRGGWDRHHGVNRRTEGNEAHA